MSGKSSSAAEWSALLEPVERPTMALMRPDDPHMGECTEFWNGNLASLKPGRAVMLYQH